MRRDKEGLNEKWICNTQVFPLIYLSFTVNYHLFKYFSVSNGLNLPTNYTKQLEPSGNLYMVIGLRIVQFGF